MVKEKMRELSRKLMEGDETPAVLNEYSKWEAIMSQHPDYLLEQSAEQQVTAPAALPCLRPHF